MVSFFSRNKTAPNPDIRSQESTGIKTLDADKGDQTSPGTPPGSSATTENLYTVNTVWEKEETRSAVISDTVYKSVDSILMDDPAQKFRYFLMELIRKNSGVKTPRVTLQKDTVKDLIKVDVPGTYKNEGSVYRLWLDNNAKRKETAMGEYTIPLWNIEVTLSKYSSEIIFWIPKRIKDSDLDCARIFFEEKFLKEFNIDDKELLTEAGTKESLGLESSDSVLISENRLQIIIGAKNKPAFTPEILEKIIVELNDCFQDYSVRKSSDDFLLSGFLKDRQSLSVYDTRKQRSYKTYMKWDDNSISIEISTDSSSKPDKEFITKFSNYYVRILRGYTQKWPNALSELRSAGIHVEEQDPEKPRKSLEELYVEEHFLGYKKIKELIETNVIFPWIKREEYATLWREKFPHAKNMIPNSVLFEGGPGTGKTTEAKIIGKFLGYPFIYIPVGKIVTKWYGESEKKLDTVLELARRAWEQYGWVVVMIDEIDEIGLNRDSSHEATGRITGVLLKKLDGIEKIGNLLLIGSTNRMKSMDPALLSRFSQKIYFPVPPREDICPIFQHYIPEAVSITEDMVSKLENRSGREIQNIADDIIRQYARETIINEKKWILIEDLIKQKLDSLEVIPSKNSDTPAVESGKPL